MNRGDVRPDRAAADGAEDAPGGVAAARAGSRLLAAAAPLLLLAAALALRALGFVPAVIDTDEGLYILQARAWLRGDGWPLAAVWDMHPVGAPALFALAMALLGESLGAVRLFGAIAVALTGWALHGAARAAGAPRAVALGAGLLYAAYSVRLGGLATNTELLLAPFVAAAMAIAIRAAGRAAEGDGAAPRWGEIVAMGLLVGAALTVKPVAAPEGSLAFLLPTLPAWWRGALPWRRGLAMAGAYAALCAAPTGLFALAYALHGAFAAFLDGSFLAPLRYAGGRAPLDVVAWQVGTALLVLTWLLVFAGLALLVRHGRGAAGWFRRLTAIGALWFVAATLAVVMPGMYFDHYFLIWLPPLSLLAAAGAWWLATARIAPLARRAGLVAFALLIGALSVNSWLGDAVPRLRRGIGLREPDPVREVAAALAATVPRGAPVLIANYHPVVYALADVGLATRYAFPAQLTGPYGAVAGIDMDAEVARVLGARPAAIVVDRGWWTAMRPAVRGMVEEALAAGYELAATVREERGPVEIWRRR
ncbi:glycosyltransferase family 39 protein [Caldovatus aquaticus]|uniref:Glycosyltransferase family 39 protein n=1 Tax=Caldovatus aquaticus TaxID=2865671 RepID=A0ABS7F220_9PROT|nr:glycosyltransferase family 39 protein [Caldovatus aquaticus]MBW8269675.1 glycosyltransferase family 39 protein [Caldovatus aquaticus]